MRIMEGQNDENVTASHEFSQNGNDPSTANRLLGNRQAFMPNPNAINQITEGKPHDTMQTYTTQANSEFAQVVEQMVALNEWLPRNITKRILNELQTIRTTQF